MTEPWFDPNLYAWIPGTLLGVLGGVEGTLAGCLAPKGKAKGLVLGFHFTCLGICDVLLATGVVAWVTHQPKPVWYALGYPGLLGLVIFGGLSPMLFRAYRAAEARKAMAQDL